MTASSSSQVLSSACMMAVILEDESATRNLPRLLRQSRKEAHDRSTSPPLPSPAARSLRNAYGSVPSTRYRGRSRRRVLSLRRRSAGR